AAPVAREPPPGAERESLVHAQADTLGALGDRIRLAADVENGCDAAAQELGHREVDAGERRLLVLRAVAHRQELEQARVPELRAPAVFDERAIERRAAEMRVRADEPR